MAATSNFRSRRTTSATPTAWSYAPQSTEPRPSFMTPLSFSKSSVQAPRATTGSSKPANIRPTPSVQRYIMLEQDSVNAVVYARSGDAWTHEILVADSILALPEIGVELHLAELYEGIVFEAQDQSDQPTESEPS